MLRRSIVGMFVLTLVWTLGMTAGLNAQIKEVKPINEKQMKPKIVDINSAPEADIVAVGIDKTVAKKIVEGRPYRNKRDLVSRQLLTMEQYNKLKEQLVAKQAPKK